MYGGAVNDHYNMTNNIINNKDKICTCLYNNSLSIYREAGTNFHANVIKCSKKCLLWKTDLRKTNN